MSDKRRFGISMGSAVLLLASTALPGFTAATGNSLHAAPSMSAVPPRIGTEVVPVKANKRDVDPATDLVTQAIAKINMGDFKGALPMLDDAVKKFPNSAMAYAYRGLCEYDLNMFPEAVADETKAVTIAPTYAFAFNIRGQANVFGTKDYKGAIADETQALGIDASDANEWYTRAVARMNSTQYVEALADLCVTIDFNPNWYWSHWYRSWAFSDLNMWKLAQGDAEQCIVCDPKNGDAYWLLGRALENQQLKDAAIVQYQKANDIYKANNNTTGQQWVADALKRLQA